MHRAADVPTTIGSKPKNARGERENYILTLGLSKKRRAYIYIYIYKGNLISPRQLQLYCISQSTSLNITGKYGLCGRLLYMKLGIHYSSSFTLCVYFASASRARVTGAVRLAFFLSFSLISFMCAVSLLLMHQSQRKINVEAPMTIVCSRVHRRLYIA